MHNQIFHRAHRYRVMYIVADILAFGSMNYMEVNRLRMQAI